MALIFGIAFNLSRLLAVLVVSIFLFSPAPGSAALRHPANLESEAVGPVVAIEPVGFRKNELEVVLRATGIAIGKPLDVAQIDRGIRELHRKGDVQAIFIESTKVSGGLKITVRGERARRLGQVKYTGIDNDILEEVSGRMGLEEGKIADVRALTALRERLKAAYEARGYYNAEVHFNYVDIKGDQSDLEVSVTLNRPAHVTNVKILGAPADEVKTIRGLVTIKDGGLFTRKALEYSIEQINLYLKKNQYPTSRVDDTSFKFNDAKTEVEISISLRMNERYQFQFSGNTVFDELELRELFTDEVLTQSDSGSKIAELVESKYRVVGYHFCKVKVQTLLREKERLSIVRFDINEGPKVRIDLVEFSGRTGDFSPAQLRDLFFEVAPGVLARKVYWEEGLPEAVKAFKTALEARGYLSVAVSPPKVHFTADRKGAELLIDVELGVQTLVAAIELKGITHAPRAKIEELLGIKTNEPFSREKLADGRAQIITYYQGEGYADVKFTDEGGQEGWELSKDGKGAILKISLVEGTRYYVGKLSLEGNIKTRDFVIMREVQLAPGDVFDPARVRRSEERVATLGLFSRVEIVSTQSPSAADRKDLKVVVRETRPGLGEFGFGGGYEDPFLRARTFFGIAYRNLWGLNQTASARTELALPLARQGKFFPFVEYSGSLVYRSPYPFDIPLTFVGQLVFDSLQIGTILSGIYRLQSSTKLEGRIEKKFSPRFTGLYRLYQLARYKTENVDDPDPTHAPVIEVIGSTGPGMILDFRDDIYNPTKGSYHILNVEIGGPALLSGQNIAFAMTTSRNTFFIPLISPFQFQFYVGLGYAKALYSDSTIPTARLTSDLSLGGRSSIRGFSFGRFSPVPDTNTGHVQEAAYYNLRGELSAGIFSNVSAAVFYDTGQVYSNHVPEGQHDGVGIGIRYKTPVGPIVVDLAQGLGNDREMLKFYFTVGTL